MKKIALLLSAVFLFSGVSVAQMFNELKKERPSDSTKVFITVFTRAGLGSYSYDPNKDYGSSYSSYLDNINEDLFVFTFPIGAFAVYNLAPVNLGGGVKFQSYSPDRGEAFNLSKFYARIEVVLNKRAKTNLRLASDIGTFTTSKVIGSDFSGPFFVDIGFSAGFPINDNLIFHLEYLFEYNHFTSIINAKSSSHSIMTNQILAGLRFGLK